jgi:hypothetical protein
MRSATSLSARGAPLRSDAPATLCDHFVIKPKDSIGRTRLDHRRDQQEKLVLQSTRLQLVWGDDYKLTVELPSSLHFG